MVDDLDIKLSEIYIDKNKSHMYDELSKDPDSPFMDTTQATVFMFAMAYAKKNNMAPKEFKRSAKLPGHAFGEEMRAVMRSIVIDEKDNVYAIGDNKMMRKLCEGYANAGIDTLYLKIKQRPLGQLGEDVLVEMLKS